MPDKQGQPLADLPDEVFDGEKFSVEVKTEKCKHKIVLIDPTHIQCKKCRVGWEGPQVIRLYEAYKQSHKKA